MFSINQKISSRQLYRNSAAGFISLSALLPPLLMNRENIVGIGLALLLLGLLMSGCAVVPRPQSDAVKVLCYFHYWILGTMVIRLTGLLIQEFLLTDTSLWVILVWFYAVCYYNLYKGLECRVRVSEVLFPFFVILLIVLSVLMHGELEWNRLKELEYVLDRDQLALGYKLFCWLGAVQCLWHLHGQLQDEKKWSSGIWKIWLSGTVITILWSLFTYCIYGNKGHTGLVFPLANAMTLAHFPGNVIGRMDALFVFAWIIGLFILCSSLFAPLADGEPDLRRKYVLFAVMAASFCAALQPECIECGEKLLYYVTTPLQIILLLVYALKGRGKKITAACLVFCLTILLQGCGSQELEKQSLVLAIGVDAGTEAPFALTFCFGSSKKGEEQEPFTTEAASFAEAEEAYRKDQYKQMDFNHLKNIYFSKDILGTEAFEDLLTEIQTDSIYSRGTLVHVAEGDASEAAKKKEQPQEGNPIHRLLNDWYNEGKIWQSSE